MNKLFFTTCCILGIFIVIFCYVIFVYQTAEREKPIDISQMKIVTICSILPQDTVFDDIDFLLPILKNKSIVLLGEAMHNDETTFAAKTRLIKFLHEKLGFSVLCFEAGQFEPEYLLSENQPIDSLFFKKTLWNHWVNSESCRQLFSYIQELQATDNTMSVRGFDIQPSGNLLLSGENRTMGNNNYLKVVDDYLQKKGDSLNRFQPIKPMLFYINYPGFLGKFGQSKYDTIHNNISVLLDICNKPPLSSQDTVFANFFRNFEKYIEMVRMEYGSNKRFQFRDSLMADNFSDILNHFPNRKIIVWLSNLHALYDDSQYRTNSSIANFNTFGEYLHTKYEDQIYSLCFTGFCTTDETGKILEQAGFSSLENSLHQLNYKYAFINFDEITKEKYRNRPFTSRCNQNMNLKANWTEMCDGIFYIDTIKQNVQYE
jgi:erythromycin esterase-like protein